MIREIKEVEKKAFDRIAPHPLQTWEWGEFRQKTGVGVSRLGRFDGEKLTETAQITWHKIPKTSFCIGYWPKGVIPSKEMIEAVQKEARVKNAFYIKLEPNILEKSSNVKLQMSNNLVRGRSLFTKWSVWLDLDKSETELLAGMKQKTRYNTKLAEKKGVKIIEDNSEEGFAEYWKLTKETTKRQGFYAHTEKYHRQMFETLQPAGIAHLFRAEYQGRTLATWIVFLVNGILYYPYGASTREDGNVFASNLLMWEVIKWGKKKGAKLFDMWGSPGPDPKPTDPWAGFHRFKIGYGAEVVEFVGSFDLVINPLLYWPYRLAESIRWKLLRLISRI